MLNNITETFHTFLFDYPASDKYNVVNKLYQETKLDLINVGVLHSRLSDQTNYSVTVQYLILSQRNFSSTYASSVTLLVLPLKYVAFN